MNKGFASLSRYDKRLLTLMFNKQKFDSFLPLYLDAQRSYNASKQQRVKKDEDNS